MEDTDDSGRQFWSLFRTLREAISETPEGKGGVSAISGFAFQFLVSLEEMVANAQEADRVRVFLESLSDLTVSRGDNIEVTQLKLTLSSSATGKGMEELWRIHQQASIRTPELVPRLSYRLLGSKTAPKSSMRSVEKRLKTWKPSGTFDQEQLDEFRDKLSAGINSDPRLSLATSLVNQFAIGDPFARIDKWIGMLLGVDSHAQLTTQANAIAIDLKALAAHKREVDARFRLWSASDRPPEDTLRETDRKKWVLTGQAPGRNDLREGRFAPRRVYSEVAGKAEEWLGSCADAPRAQISAFWIAGRSGSGKSVALLHLLSALHEAIPDRVILWLGDNSRRIGDAVRWCRPFLREGHQVIIAADDPFTSAKQAEVVAALELARAEIEALGELDTDTPQPVLILCGPTEQAEAFTYELSDYVETLLFLFPHETREDIEDLRAWYLRRTGATSLALEETEDVLIVQLFFEWATGEKLESFSRRLEERLRDFAPDVKPGLLEIVAKILAVNRLYALYPAAAIDAELAQSPEIEAGFRQVALVDGHFSLDTRMGGYRLTHPHLADAIYRTWFDKPRDAGYRKAHLRKAFKAALEYGNGPSQRFAPLWAISRLASPRASDNPDSLRIELIREDLKQVLPEMFATHFSATTEPLVGLPVWAGLDTYFELGLAPSPVEELIVAAEYAPADSPGLRLTCHILIEVAGERSATRDTVHKILLDYGDWHEWPKVMLSYVKRYGLGAILPQLKAFARDDPSRARALVFAIVWGGVPGQDSDGQAILRNWFQLDAPYLQYQAGVLSNVIERWGCDNWIRDVAIRFLSGFPKHRSWSHLWEKLPTEASDQAREVDTLGREWLADRDPEKSNHDRVWQALWANARGDEVLRKIAIDWLEAEPGHASWSYVWQDVWATKPEADVRKIAIDWLEAQPEHASWQFTWEKLWEVAPGDADVRKIALDWLEAEPEHASWQFTWEKLWEVAPGDADVRKIAIDWLEAEPEHASWKFTWEKLWEVAPGDADVRKIALDWLEAEPGHASWSYVWQDVWATKPEADVRKIAIDWLEAQPEHASWQFTWEKLWEVAPGDADVRKIALDWLEAEPEHASWKFTWEKLWEVAPGDADVRKIAIDWLKIQPGHQFWIFTWNMLWTATPGDAALQEVALDWLEAEPEHASWKFTWEKLWEVAPGDADVRKIAIDWLKIQPGHQFWIFTWNMLWTATPGDAALQEVALEWLKTPRDYAGLMRRCLAGTPSQALSWEWSDKWKIDWRDAANDVTRRRSLFTEALTTLSETLPELGGWTSVWNLLWENRGQDPTTHAELQKIAIEWLFLTDPEHPRWAPLWCTLWGDMPDTIAPGTSSVDRLSSQAIDWLSGPTRRLFWPSVWLALWRDCVHLREHLGSIVRSGARSDDFTSEPDTEVVTCLRS